MSIFRNYIGMGKGLASMLMIIIGVVLYSPVLIAQSDNTPRNVYSPLITDNYDGVVVSTTSTPLLTSFSNEDNVIEDVDDAATYNYAVTGTGSLRVTESNATTDPFPAGSYAGFVTDNTILDIEIIGETTITTYLNDEEQESVSAADLITLGLIDDRAKVGFVTEEPFDAVEISYAALGLTGSKLIYYAEILTPDDSTPVECNVRTPWVQADPDESDEEVSGFPVIIEPERTGVDGVSLAALQNTENVVSPDIDEFATIDFAAGLIGGSASISVKDIGERIYPGGYFAGFEISNPVLLGLDLLDLLNNITVSTYLDGVLVESESGSGDNLVLSVSLLDAPDRYTVGFVTDENAGSFDEVRITVGGELVDLDLLGTTLVYHPVIINFSNDCEGDLQCGTNYLNIPEYPVYTNSRVSGLACVDCSVDNEAALLSEDSNDYTTISVPVGVAGSASVSVVDQLSVYPAGTTAGFVIQDLNSLLQLDLFDSLTLCTYLDGSERECVSGGSTLRLSVTTDFISPGSDRYNVSFVTSEPYNEVRLSVSSLASVENNVRVYNAFVESYEDESGDPCDTIEITLTGGDCWRTLTSPYYGVTYSSMFDGFWTQGIPGSDYPEAEDPNIYTWDLEAQQWEPLDDMEQNIDPATGFLVTIFSDDEYGQNLPPEEAWPKTITIPVGPQVEVQIRDDQISQQSNGFTLIGNPFAANISLEDVITNELTGAYYVYDRNAGGTTNGSTGGWRSNADGFGEIEDNAIAPGQGFFVQNIEEPDNPYVEINGMSKTGNGEFYGKSANRLNYVRLEVQGDGTSNPLWLRFSDNGSNEQVFGDALQLKPMSSDYAILSAEKTGIDDLLEIAHFPFPEPEDNLNVPIHLVSTVHGEFSLTVTDLDKTNLPDLYLKDRITSALIKLKEGETYRFDHQGIHKPVSMTMREGATIMSYKLSEPETARFSLVTARDQAPSEVPDKTTLYQNYPNPFNPSTNIRYDLGSSADVTLTVYDITGREIAVLVDAPQEAGHHSVQFHSGSLASGVYLYRLQANGQALTRKFTIIR